MLRGKFCDKYLSEDYEHYVAEYRGDFQGQVDKLDYVCGTTITDTLAVVAVEPNKLSKLREDVPSIIKTI